MIYTYSVVKKTWYIRQGFILHVAWYSKYLKQNIDITFESIWCTEGIQLKCSDMKMWKRPVGATAAWGCVIKISDIIDAIIQTKTQEHIFSTLKSFAPALETSLHPEKLDFAELLVIWPLKMTDLPAVTHIYKCESFAPLHYTFQCTHLHIRPWQVKVL